MKSQRYTESQVLCGLREAWQMMIGVDATFDAEISIVEYMKADGTWEELDCHDIWRGLESFFDFNCNDQEWGQLFGLEIAERSIEEWEQRVAPKLTFGVLAQFVADRTTAIASFDSITILGRECASAGAFTGIQQVLGNETNKAFRFGPSSKIIDVLRGHKLDKFWMQARWIAEDRIPELPSYWREVTTCAGCLGFCAVLFSTFFVRDPMWIGISLLGAVALYLAARVYKQFKNPMPENIVTFRDLSMLVANDQTQSTK